MSDLAGSLHRCVQRLEERYAAITALQARVAELEAERDHFKGCISAREVRAIVDERDKFKADLAAKDATLGEMTGLARKAEAELAAAQIIAATGHPSPCTLGPLCPYCEIERLRANLAAARADAERYRWLRKVATPPTLAGIAWGNSEAACKFSDPDAAIDAALAGEKK